MAEYTFDAIVRLRVKDVEDFMEAAAMVEEFFSIGLEQLAYSSDDEDNHYSIDGVNIDWNSSREW